MDRELYNKDLLNIILQYVPLTQEERRRRKRVVSELKHLYCEWSEHNKYCYVCKPYHPLVINRRKRYRCEECESVINWMEAILEDYIIMPEN